MKPQRSYSDPEIARYVLGLDLPEQAQGIQALLAHDDAAAARALKWEAYLLNIVDALPTASPPDALLEQIEETLGMTFEAPAQAPVVGESRTRARPSPDRARRVAWPGWLRGLSVPWTRLKATWRPSKRFLWTVGGAGLVVVVLAVLVISASLHTTPSTVVQQTVTTAH